jgi:hypothetical protein
MVRGPRKIRQRAADCDSLICKIITEEFYFIPLPHNTHDIHQTFHMYQVNFFSIVFANTVYEYCVFSGPCQE